MRNKCQSQITFLYCQDVATLAPFYEDVLGFEVVDDQGFAKIYRVSGNAFVGIVSGDRGFHKPQEKSAVLITLLVDDVPAWYDYLKGQGVKILREMQTHADIQVRCFFFEDPAGYAFEVQQFLKPELAEIFHKN